MQSQALTGAQVFTGEAFLDQHAVVLANGRVERVCPMDNIVDGHHVHPATVSVALRAKPKGKLYLVTDSMATVGSATKSFDLYGETIKESGGRLVNHEGRLAGSAISMIDAVRTTCQTVGVALEECLRMASFYPAKFIGESERRGRIASGF